MIILFLIFTVRAFEEQPEEEDFYLTDDQIARL